MARLNVHRANNGPIGIAKFQGRQCQSGLHIDSRSSAANRHPLVLWLIDAIFFASCPTYRREHFFFLFLFSFGIISVIINFRARKSSAAPYTTFLRFLPLMNQVRGMILKRRYRIRLPARRISPRHDSCGCREEETCACERVATSRSQVVGRMAAEGGSQSFDSL